MAFPQTPSNGDTFTTTNGTMYQYVAADKKWRIFGLTGIVGPQGETGEQGDQGVQGDQGDTGASGVTGLVGTTGVQGIQGDQGDQGETGSQGVTGLVGVTGVQGVQGDQGDTGSQGETGPGATGVQGVTGLQGAAGSQGDTGAQGETGVVAFALYDAGTMTGDQEIDWSNGKKQTLSIGSGADGDLIYFTNGVAGANTTLIISYAEAETPGITGVYWPSGNAPTLSGENYDIVNLFYDGSNYFGQASLDFQA